MILSANQPYFFPFPGFFYKAYLSDIFVILDNVQFPRGTTWINRNRFKNDQGSLWMTVPVKKKGLGFQKIDAVRICYDGRWPKKHLESLKNAYSRAPYFKVHIGFLEALWSTKFEKLIDLNHRAIRYLMQQLKIETKVILSSELGIRSTGDKLLIEICEKMGASRFLTQSAAQKYLDADRFADAGIRLTQFKQPLLIYPQLWGSFIPNLSALDLIFNCGPKGHDIMIGD
ncbi:MAG: WbqC family protein [Deltaproteobacteria bacterium]|nr:WbqC family protein [Deltaproteobacteria bacterium]MBW1747897.1 WbqC family protein [Deltaproteobacteria bacterium]MBW1825834.1 WbqC family protein [Deltaproteobacteria bacterium]MBW1968733.1 WbqC family protein [Deltaproteobacteria bacterium]MBW2155041.1 WbqC family protein [Deltaproteobacteria bacterium]